MEDRTIHEIVQTLAKLALHPEELQHWSMSIETAAKSMSRANDDKINFEYHPDVKMMRFFVEDPKSRDDLITSIQVHLPLIPEFLQGFFSVFKYNLKNLKFDE